MLVVPKAPKSVSIPRDATNLVSRWSLAAVNTRTGDRLGTVRRGSHQWRSWWLHGCDKVAQLDLKDFSKSTACIEKRRTLGGTYLNVGCIPSKAMLNNSHIHHQPLHNIKKRGIHAKEDSVNGLTKCVEILFEQNKVDYIKGTASFVSPNTISVQLIDGGESIVEAKNIIVVTWPEVTPFSCSAIEIDEQQIVSWMGALLLRKVSEKMVIIGGGIMGPEMGRVRGRLGAEVTVVEFLNSIGCAGIDEISKRFQKSLMKHGLKFELSTKVLSAVKRDGKVVVTIEVAEDGRQDSLEADVVLVAVGRRPYIHGLGLENVGVEVDSRGRIVIDDRFNTSVSNIKCISDVTFGLILAHKAEEEGIAAVEYIHNGHDHVKKTEQELKNDGVKYKVGWFPFLANLRAKTNLDTEGQVKFLVDAEMDRILGVHIIGPNTGE
ncbi:dihydrolipoyl dehydrogenase [Lactarius indigo]|nr:dihydrolipoyl dehydrogenase [Lactarius indigo]